MPLGQARPPLPNSVFYSLEPESRDSIRQDIRSRLISVTSHLHPLHSTLLTGASFRTVGKQEAMSKLCHLRARGSDTEGTVALEHHPPLPPPLNVTNK